MPNKPIEKALQELRHEHSILCAAITALEAVVAEHPPSHRRRRRLHPRDASWGGAGHRTAESASTGERLD
jgi:hypothetical protein